MHRDLIRMDDRHERELSKLEKEYKRKRDGFDRVYDKALARVEKAEAHIERRLSILEGRGA